MAWTRRKIGSITHIVIIYAPVVTMMNYLSNFLDFYKRYHNNMQRSYRDMEQSWSYHSFHNDHDVIHAKFVHDKLWFAEIHYFLRNTCYNLLVCKEKRKLLYSIPCYEGKNETLYAYWSSTPCNSLLSSYKKVSLHVSSMEIIPFM